MTKPAHKDWPPRLVDACRGCQLVLMVLAGMVFAKAAAIALMWSGGGALALLRHVVGACQA